MSPLFRTLAMAMALFFGSMAQAYDHGAWDDLLKKHVQPLRGGLTTAVDYAGMAQDRAELKDYLAGLAGVPEQEFQTWPAPEQLAFLINAYNAWTVEFILTKWPDIESIKDLGSFFRSPWKKAFIPLFGETISLDDIEHGMIRADGIYEDPRIHFAVNCASVGCPSLRAEAYRGDQLADQLDQQTDIFLSDRTRNREQDGKVALSSIFKWYRGDFERGWGGYRSLNEFLLEKADVLGLSEELRGALRKDAAGIKYLDYDWSLNRQPS